MKKTSIDILDGDQKEVLQVLENRIRKYNPLKPLYDSIKEQYEDKILSGEITSIRWYNHNDRRRTQGKIWLKTPLDFYQDLVKDRLNKTLDDCVPIDISILPPKNNILQISLVYSSTNDVEQFMKKYKVYRDEVKPKQINIYDSSYYHKRIITNLEWVVVFNKRFESSVVDSIYIKHALDIINHFPITSMKEYDKMIELHVDSRYMKIKKDGRLDLSDEDVHQTALALMQILK